MHVDYILSLYSQTVFAMKRLLDQGLAIKYLHNVFQATIVTRILYALPAWGCFPSNELSGRIDAYLKRFIVMDSHPRWNVWTLCLIQPM